MTVEKWDHNNKEGPINRNKGFKRQESREKGRKVRSKNVSFARQYFNHGKRTTAGKARTRRRYCDRDNTICVTLYK